MSIICSPHQTRAADVGSLFVQQSRKMIAVSMGYTDSLPLTMDAINDTAKSVLAYPKTIDNLEAFTYTALRNRSVYLATNMARTSLQENISNVSLMDAQSAGVVESYREEWTPEEIEELFSYMAKFLSKRELYVLRLCVDGLTSKQIAIRMHTTWKAVTRTIERFRQKTNLNKEHIIWLFF